MKKHGACLTSEYHIWANMIYRCYTAKPGTQSFAKYRALGVKVCDRWRESFANFLADMGKRPTPKHSIDRFPNNGGDYTPDNCRWATRKEQQRNLRNCTFVEYQGRRLSITDLAEEVGVDSGLLYGRFVTRGWPLEKAIATPKIGNCGRFAAGSDPRRRSEMHRKLTMDQANEIRRMFKPGLSADIARRFCVDPSTVLNIVRNRYYIPESRETHAV